MTASHTSSIERRNRIGGMSPSTRTGGRGAQGDALHYPHWQSIAATLLTCVTVGSSLASTGCTTLRVIPPTGLGGSAFVVAHQAR